MALIELTCLYCEIQFNRLVSRHNQKIKKGYTKIFCSQKCSSLFRVSQIKIETVRCLNCDIEIIKVGKDPRKFCSQSCAGTYNNILTPKRQVESFCALCGIPNSASRKYCSDCWETTVPRGKPISFWEDVTLGELKGRGNANAGGRYPYIRNLSRKKYIKSELPMCCAICGYSLHVDIAHIKAVSSYSEDALISEINSLSNLIPLCKNHHWEYDHGYLKV